MDATALKHLVSSLLSALDIAVDDVSVREGSRTVVAVTSPHSKELIGPQGETLRAINSIARRLAETKYGEKAASFLIDVNGY